MMPALALYEYFARNMARDMMHTVFARLIKIEALTKLNMFGEAIGLMETVQKAENLPNLLEEKPQNTKNKSKWVNFLHWI